MGQWGKKVPTALRGSKGRTNIYNQWLYSKLYINTCYDASHLNGRMNTVALTNLDRFQNKPILGQRGYGAGSSCLSVCLSVCDTFFTMFLSSDHHEISGVTIIDKSDDHAKGQGQRSKVKVTEVKTNFAPIWWFPDCNSSLNSPMAMK